jgi:hypothetical protein
MIGAEAHVGPVDVELIQPVDGPSIYKEWWKNTVRAFAVGDVFTSRLCLAQACSWSN